MAKYVILRDSRLSGTFQSELQVSDADLRIITTSASTRLQTVFDQINGLGSSVAGRTLFILCHGYAGSSAVRLQGGDFGGMGLQLGQEGVLHSNVSVWSAVTGVFQNIIVYACGAGDTQPGAEGTTADGAYLMGALAIHTGANVYAADRIQWYSPTGFNFGRWEGQLFRHPPSGSDRVAVTSEPLKLSQVAANL